MICSLHVPNSFSIAFEVPHAVKLYNSVYNTVELWLRVAQE